MEQLPNVTSARNVLALRDTRRSLELGYATGDLGNEEIRSSYI